MLGEHARLGLRLRPAVVRHRARLVLLHVRASLAAVEDDVGREVQEASADRVRGGGDIPRAVDRDRPGAGTVLPVRRMDYDVGPQTFEQRANSRGIADLHSLGRDLAGSPNELRPEVPAAAGDVELHEVATDRGKRCQPAGRWPRCRQWRTSSTTSPSVSATPSAMSSPSHGRCSNVLPPK